MPLVDIEIRCLVCDQVISDHRDHYQCRLIARAQNPGSAKVVTKPVPAANGEGTGKLEAPACWPVDWR